MKIKLIVSVVLMVAVMSTSVYCAENNITEMKMDTGYTENIKANYVIYYSSQYQSYLIATSNTPIVISADGTTYTDSNLYMLRINYYNGNFSFAGFSNGGYGTNIFNYFISTFNATKVDSNCTVTYESGNPALNEDGTLRNDEPILPMFNVSQQEYLLHINYANFESYEKLKVKVEHYNSSQNKIDEQTYDIPTDSHGVFDITRTSPLPSIFYLSDYYKFTMYGLDASDVIQRTVIDSNLYKATATEYGTDVDVSFKMVKEITDEYINVNYYSVGGSGYNLIEYEVHEQNVTVTGVSTVLKDSGVLTSNQGTITLDSSKSYFDKNKKYNVTLKVSQDLGVTEVLKFYKTLTDLTCNPADNKFIEIKYDSSVSAFIIKPNYDINLYCEIKSTSMLNLGIHQYGSATNMTAIVKGFNRYIYLSEFTPQILDNGVYKIYVYNSEGQQLNVLTFTYSGGTDDNIQDEGTTDIEYNDSFSGITDVGSFIESLQDTFSLFGYIYSVFPPPIPQILGIVVVVMMAWFALRLLRG